MPAVVTIYTVGNNGKKLPTTNGVGSGFLISQDGFIVTNYHVIKDSTRLIVKLANGKKFEGKIVGVSKRTDLAVLKISSRKKLPYLKFADTNKVKIGHYAIAIGSPFTLSQTMTTGIVSFKGRELGIHYKEDYIQTDAAINPGNSGGPLLDINGNVIGVNDCLIGLSNKGAIGNVGLGFAIDANLAKLVILYILKSSNSPKPYTGITMVESKKSQLPIIKSVIKNSPADIAGLKKGDYITRIGNKKISSIWDVKTTIIALYEPNDVAMISFVRNQKEMYTKIKFGAKE
jgi:serine protease Do